MIVWSASPADDRAAEPADPAAGQDTAEPMSDSDPGLDVSLREGGDAGMPIVEVDPPPPLHVRSRGWPRRRPAAPEG